MVAGADVWLNTPLPPMEASGTSGMKAAPVGDRARRRRPLGRRHPAALYDKLAGAVLPLYYENPDRWRWMMKQAIGKIAYYFNSHRMMRRYATEAYLR